MVSGISPKTMTSFHLLAIYHHTTGADRGILHLPAQGLCFDDKK